MAAQEVPSDTPPNGVPALRVLTSVEEQVLDQLAAAKASDDDQLESLAKVILTSMHGHGGGSGGGGSQGDDTADRVLKDIKRHKWLAALMSLLLGSGGMVGAYFAIRDRSISNESRVELLNENQSAITPAIEKNSADIQMIQTDVGEISKSVQGIQAQQNSIAAGIESLKQVNVTRLEKENDKLERELRAERRNNH